MGVMSLAEQKSVSIKKQHGQAAVLVILFSAVLLTSTFAMFKAGKLTTNKMQLQNAADAAAYSVSTVEARDLNFASYMNRAIVANEVAIGQFVGLASWAYHFKSFADYIDFYDFCCLSPATLGISTPIVKAITGPWRGAGQIAVNALGKLANVATLVFHNINKIYGFAEFGYHTVSVISAIGVLDDVLSENGPPGTTISEFGILSLIAHVVTYGVLPGLPGDQFATGYMSQSKIDADKFGGQDSGYARLAALIRDSRDPFTSGESAKVCLPNIPGTPACSSFVAGRGWEMRPPGFPLNIEMHPSFGIDLVVASVEFGFDFELTFDLALRRHGGSELRFVLPGSGQIKAGQHANWSSADATDLAVILNVYFKAWAEACALGLCKDVSVGGGFKFGNSRASLYLEILGEEITIIDDMFFPTAIPFGSGFAEVGKTTPNNLGTLNMALDAPPVPGPITIDHYGGAADSALAWLSPGPGNGLTPIGIAASAEIYETLLNSRVNKGYAGLPYYVDTTGKGPFLGVGAPSLLIGLVQNEADYDTYYKNDGNVADATEPAGRLKLNEALADNELAVLSKSELYFSRPTDRLATHFHRGDGMTEVGSAFNPYWQARLVDTSYADRTLGLAIQQKEDFINLSQSFSAITNKLASFFP